jgi:hypothetical protein
MEDQLTELGALEAHAQALGQEVPFLLPWAVVEQYQLLAAQELLAKNKTAATMIPREMILAIFNNWAIGTSLKVGG